MKMLTLLLFIGCGQNGLLRYNGNRVSDHQGLYEDVEEDMQLSYESVIPNKILEESRKELLKEEKKKLGVSKEIASDSKYIKTTPEDLILDKVYHSACEDADGIKEYYFYKKRIESLGGKSIFPYSGEFPETLSGFQKFLKHTGIKHFTAYELSMGSQSILKTCELKNLMPPKSCWMRGAVLFLIAEEIRSAIGNFPLMVGSWYRSTCYNKELAKRNVSVAPKSDHLLAKAVDLSYAGKAGRVNIRKKIQNYVCEKYWKNPVYTSLKLEDGSVPNLSVGIGNTNIHIGVDSPKGRRSWLYRSYPSNDLSLADCFSS